MFSKKHQETNTSLTDNEKNSMIVNDGRQNCYRLAGNFCIFFCPPKKTERYCRTMLGLVQAKGQNVYVLK